MTDQLILIVVLNEIECNKIITVDAWEKVKPDFLIDLNENDLPFVSNSFDVVLMLDFIEHLSKDAGKKLIEDCKKICNKKIFLLTPLEEIWTDNHENVENENYWCFGNEYDLHKSIWGHLDFADWTTLTIPGFEKYYVGFYSCEK
jgi:hypothetical protein